MEAFGCFTGSSLSNSRSLTQSEEHNGIVHGFANVSRTYSSAEENAYSESDIKDFLDENFEAQNHLPDPEASVSESDIDDFKDVKQYIVKFREFPIFLHGKDSLDLLFYALSYAIRCEKLQKTDKCLDDELRRDLPKDLFDQLNAIKSDLALDLDC